MKKGQGGEKASDKGDSAFREGRPRVSLAGLLSSPICPSAMERRFWREEGNHFQKGAKGGGITLD